MIDVNYNFFTEFFSFITENKKSNYDSDDMIIDNEECEDDITVESKEDSCAEDDVSTSTSRKIVCEDYDDESEEILPLRYRVKC
jgi:hypothetical protein